jgi:hypothetical protein
MNVTLFWNMTPCSVVDVSVSDRIPTADTRVQFRGSQCGICCGPSRTGAVFFPNTAVCSDNYHSIKCSTSLILG